MSLESGASRLATRPLAGLQMVGIACIFPGACLCFLYIQFLGCPRAGEISLAIHENLRSVDAVVLQSCVAPVNDKLMELLFMISTLRRAGARSVTVVLPYFPYARQDRRMAAAVPISAADVANLLESAGVNRVITIDLHCGQIQGFFSPRIAVENVNAAPIGAAYFAGKLLSSQVVIVSPDAGGVYRAKQFMER